MEKIAISVLDYSTCNVEIYHNVNGDISVEDYLVTQGYKLSNIEYMVCDEESLTIKEHKL